MTTMGDTRASMSGPASSGPTGLSFGRGPFSTSPTSSAKPSGLKDPYSNSTSIMPTFSQVSPTVERRPTDFGAPPQLHLSTSDPSQKPKDKSSRAPAIILRNLPNGTTHKEVRNMLLFAKDLVEVSSITTLPGDAGHSAAVAIFKSTSAAIDVQKSLSGKLNASHDANMVVDVFPEGVDLESESWNSRHYARRGTMDGVTPRNQTNSASSNGSNAENYPRQTSRYNMTFQATDGISPPTTNGSHGAEFPMPDSNSHFQSLFSPRSPVSNSVRERQQNLGKSVINDDVNDDDTDGLIRDPLAFAMNGQHQISTPSGGDIISQMRNVNLNNGAFNNNSHSAVVSPSAVSNRQDYIGSGYSQTPTYSSSGYSQTPPRTSYPPANPADQNPPCNTLYVGNLPNNTSEDELKRLFSSQRGYKRLCFRTKANGPMCFVEFESVTLATQALHHLYGKMLSNSVKGGIRLSFSKNPLGVRNGQSAMPPNSAMSPQGPPPGFGNSVHPPPGFSSAAGPPPGLINGNGNNARSPGYGSAFPQDQGDYRNGSYGPSHSNGPFASQLSMPQNPGPYSNAPPMSQMGSYAPQYASSGMR